MARMPLPSPELHNSPYVKKDKYRMQSRNTSSRTPVRWGVLSTANIGVKFVAPAIHKSSNGRLVAVGSRDPQRVRKLYTFAPNLRVHNDYDSLIHDPQVEAIYNPLPNGLH